jgi:hypothetical protein
MNIEPKPGANTYFIETGKHSIAISFWYKGSAPVKVLKDGERKG